MNLLQMSFSVRLADTMLSRISLSGFASPGNTTAQKQQSFPSTAIMPWGVEES